MGQLRYLRQRSAAYAAIGILLGPMLAGCGAGGNQRTGANLPPVDESAGTGYGGQRAQNYAPQQPQGTGMSTTRKVELLAGAAALYYLYRRNQARRAQGDMSQPQYYLSRNGRVYFRDSTGRVHWVTAPAGGIQVPADEAQQYSGFQGYGGQMQGRTLQDLSTEGGNAMGGGQ